MMTSHQRLQGVIVAIPVHGLELYHRLQCILVTSTGNDIHNPHYSK